MIPSGDHDNHLKEFSKNPNKGYYKHAHRGHKIFNQKFEKLKEVRLAKNTVLVVHDENKLTIIQV
ncbi:DUF6849 domain-containing protein [Thermococcus sp. PK]|uniref:DUF6849 domain-containing protein n=1 Tax=Thermococcus sp. PK TaxID=913025 RepID=UPI000A68B1E3